MKGTRWYNSSRRVIYINGIGNSPVDHAKSAKALSLLQCCPVIGVYNCTDGLWSDLGQCLSDKINLVGVQAEIGRSFDGWTQSVDEAYQSLRQSRPGLDKRDMVADFVSANKATLAIYGLYAGQGRLGPMPIYCHSQGNLITSNALTAVALALGPAAIKGLEVNSFGSPCRYWPPGLNRTNYAFTFDPVSWLDLRTDLTSSKVGFIAAHGFDSYLDNYAEFVVNRFRWGSFGLTASMDEAGLATFMVRHVRNPDRLCQILERLLKAHWSDSDDVALLYVEAVSDGHLQMLKRANARAIELLITCLETGWTTAREKAAIGRLRAV